jgi:hypothetical protein
MPKEAKHVPNPLLEEVKCLGVREEILGAFDIYSHDRDQNLTTLAD